MLEKLESKGHDLWQLFNVFAQGGLPFSKIVDVVSCSMEDLNNEKIKETDKAAIARDIIERHGLQEAGIIARAMLNYAMIGDKKKQQIDKGMQMTQAVEGVIGSPSMSLKKRGLLWAAHWLSLVVPVCLIIKFF